MPAARTLRTLVIALLAALPLSGCQSDQLTECNKKNSFLEHRITEYKQRTDVLDSTVQLQMSEIEDLRMRLAKAEAKVAALEKENTELQYKLALKLEGTKGMIEGLDELKRMQREAAEKLRQQEAENAAQSASPAPPQQ